MLNNKTFWDYNFAHNISAAMHESIQGGEYYWLALLKIDKTV